MSDTPVTLQFEDALGRRQQAQARLIDGTWRINAVVGQRRISRDCDTWQAVERAVIWLRRHGHEPEEPAAAPPLAAVFALLAVLLGVGAAGAQPVVPSAAEQQFTAATQEYAWMHRRLEAIVGPIEISSDMAQIDRAVQTLATAIAAERSTARAGDLFTPAIAVELRNRIAWSLAAHDLSPQDVREAELVEGVDPTLVSLRVNGRFPWSSSSAMFPCLLQVLPPLPAELQYRIVGDTLVLIDVHASLIVDLLPAVLSPATER